VAPAAVAFACPECGAPIRDASSEWCPYCKVVFRDSSPDRWLRVWHTSDEGATWTVRQRRCGACGAPVKDSSASRCQDCGSQLEKLAPRRDPRPTVAITVELPPIPAGAQRWRHVVALVRYVDCNHWPVPPSVPAAIAALLPMLPDDCPGCETKAFKVALAASGAWEVVCGRCGAAPGVRS
jgi:hypothetical protein